LTKPPYQVPSMKEIRALPWNGFNAISTFSGCGGSSLGYRMAGFRVLWANEFIDAARDSYNANKALYTIVDGRDIRSVTAADILTAINLKEGELDLFDGSPPCASFSTAGKREAGWGKVKKYSDKEQRTDDLFFEYIRLLRGLKPKVFVAENVSGLVKGTAKGYFIEIMKELKASGYRVSCKVLDAQWLGVPQARQRTIFVGVRDDLGIDPAHPKPLAYRYSVRDALPWIVMQGDNGGFGEGDNGGFGEGAMRAAIVPSPTIGAGPSTGNGRFSPAVVEAETDISRYAIGAEWERMGKPGTQSEKYFSLTRPALDGPSGTITQRGGDNTCASVCHPTEKRKFSIAELKRICAFPDDFIFTGTYAQQWERMGRAVPPVMMSHIAATIRDQVLAKIP
jgi:DNA (cytosine-5)-methyltransferase 1